MDLDLFAVSLEHEEGSGKWAEALKQMASEIMGTPGFSDHKKLFPEFSFTKEMLFSKR